MPSGEMLLGRWVGGKFVPDGPLIAVRGKLDCMSLECTRMGGTGINDIGRCIGWHCGTCGEPADAQGMCRNRCNALPDERNSDA